VLREVARNKKAPAVARVTAAKALIEAAKPKNGELPISSPATQSPCLEAELQ
jgi:hypothetical protein